MWFGPENQSIQEGYDTHKCWKSSLKVSEFISVLDIYFKLINNYKNVQSFLEITVGDLEKQRKAEGYDIFRLQGKGVFLHGDESCFYRKGKCWFIANNTTLTDANLLDDRYISILSYHGQ